MLSDDAEPFISIHETRPYTVGKPAWTVRYEDHKPPGRGYCHPHVVIIWRYVHEKTARNRYMAEVNHSRHYPTYQIDISLTHPSGTEVDAFHHGCRTEPY
jgi:hypothetical protein